jgi:hypothetical protein
MKSSLSSAQLASFESVQNPKININRRDLLHVALAGAGVTAAGALLPTRAAAKTVDMNYKRRARYQANSVEVRNFYRVNSYPTR